MSVVSIIVPVYNTADYLEKCVESLRNQTLQDIEIILVDNLSTDGSGALCDAYLDRDPRIRVLHLDRSGLSVARNAGVRIASAPYVGFIDSDDHVDPSMYAEMLTAMEQSGADMAYCNFCYEYEDGRTEQVYRDSGAVCVRDSADVTRDIIMERVTSSACTKLFRRSLFDTHAFPEDVFFEDHITVYKWVYECKKVVWIDKPFYYYLQRSTSICHTPTPLKYYHYFLADYSRVEFLREHPLFPESDVRTVNTRLARNCFSHFRNAMKRARLSDFREECADMREKLRSFLPLKRSAIQFKYYRRVREIAYWWPLYYCIHFYFRKKTWRP